MREQIRDKGRLQHILNSIEKAAEFTTGTDFEEFRKSALLRYAVTKAVEIVGEASYRLTREFREKHNEVEWHKIIAMRHILVHGYYQAKDDVIWDTAINYLPPLKEKIQLLYDKEYD